MDDGIDDLDAQIAKLQQEKQRRLDIAEKAQREKDAAAAKILIGSTPTKKKPRFSDADLDLQVETSHQARYNLPKRQAAPAKPSLPSIPSQPTKSSLSASLASLRKTTISSSTSVKPRVPRTTSFQDTIVALTSAQAGPSRAPSQWEEELEVGDRERDDDLTILENLMPGPREFGEDPEGGHEWKHIEPNTKIRLSKRVLPHDQLQDHLSGRYFLPPSLLYSVIRLSKDGATYDVPVDGDWVTMAVVAERGEVRVSGAKEAFSDDEEEDRHPDSTGQKQGDKPMTKEEIARQKWQKRRGPRKYINLKLCALPPRNMSMGTGEIAGDAILQLLLFESDAKVHEGDGNQVKYRGGSGGAYEKWCNLSVGSVIALLNPRVLRPLKSGGQNPHPLMLPLALNPTSGDGITLVGHSKDLGCCTATLKDGKRCRNWVDLRVNAVCEFHLHAAINRGRSSRAELASATSHSYSPFGAATRTQSSRGGGAPNRGGKFGLVPRNGSQHARASDTGGGATYVVSGRTVSTMKPGISVLGGENISEKFGRNKTSRLKRKMEAEETEKALSALLENDSGFGGGSTGGKYLATLRKQTAAADLKSGKTLPEGEDDISGDKKRIFDAEAIKRIGFDPTARRGERNEDETKKRLAAIASLRDNTDRPLNLSRSKDYTPSNVRVPPSGSGKAKTEVEVDNEDDDEEMIDLD